MYRIQKRAGAVVSMTMFGKKIPEQETIVNSLKEFFDMEYYNGKVITDEKIESLIKNSSKGDNIKLEKIEDKKPNQESKVQKGTRK